MQFAERLCGLDSELLDGPCTGTMERRQRVGLPPGAIQGEHLELYEALLERMRDDERLELPQELAVPAELEVELDRLDRRREALFLESRRLGIEQLVPAGSLQRRSAPHT